MPPKNSSKKKKSSPKTTKSAQADQNIVVNGVEKCMETLQFIVETPKACIAKDNGNEVDRPLLNTGKDEVGANDTSVEEIHKEPDISKPCQGEDKNESANKGKLHLEQVVTANLERSRCMKEFRKELSELQQLTKDFDPKPEEVNTRKDRYVEAFHKFVSSHENYMQCENGTEKRDLMFDNYNDQRDVKLQLDDTVDLWWTNREKYKKAPSESGHSLKSLKSRSSRTSSSRSSVKEKRRLVEEAKLRIQTLREKQELERQLEVAEQSKTELSRKLKLLNAEAELKHAKIDYVIDQIPDDAGIDGMNAYFEKNLDKVKADKSEIAHVGNPNYSKQSILHVGNPKYSKQSIPQVETTPGQDNPSKSGISRVELSAKSKEFYPRAKPQPTITLPGQEIQPPHPQLDVWGTIAQTIKEGPSLPKIELMKFGGDPLEYVEFMTNFKDNIESQVSDVSQRFTRLLTQCVGKARETMQSCVNLDVTQRYKEAMDYLLQNFGQPHLIVEAHMKRLKELQVRRFDASALMEFVRHLEDTLLDWTTKT